MHHAILIFAFLSFARAIPVSTDSSTSASLCPCPTSKNESGAHMSEGSPALTAPSWSTTMGASHMQNTIIHGMPCLCNFGLRGMPIRDDYQYTPGIGSHKLHTRALDWNEARKMCNEEGGHLAIINSATEAHILTEIFNKSGPVKGAAYPDVAFLGIHDMYKEGEWVTILGDSLGRTGYTKWSDKWGGQPDNGGGKQHCGVLLKEGGLDDVSCQIAFAYFCELPTMQFIH